jgi:hypothetical protein
MPGWPASPPGSRRPTTTRRNSPSTRYRYSVLPLVPIAVLPCHQAPGGQQQEEGTPQVQGILHPCASASLFLCPAVLRIRILVCHQAAGGQQQQDGTRQIQGICPSTPPPPLPLRPPVLFLRRSGKPKT